MGQLFVFSFQMRLDFYNPVGAKYKAERVLLTKNDLFEINIIPYNVYFA